MQVVSLLHAVGGKLATTFSVGPSIGQQHSIAMSKKHRRVAANAFAIISDTVREHHRVAVETSGMHIPAFQDQGISSINADFLQVCLKFLAYKRFSLLTVGQWAMRQP